MLSNSKDQQYTYRRLRFAFVRWWAVNIATFTYDRFANFAMSTGIFIARICALRFSLGIDVAFVLWIEAGKASVVATIL